MHAKEIKILRVGHSSWKIETRQVYVYNTVSIAPGNNFLFCHRHQYSRSESRESYHPFSIPRPIFLGLWAPNERGGKKKRGAASGWRLSGSHSARGRKSGSREGKEKRVCVCRTTASRVSRFPFSSLSTAVDGESNRQHRTNERTPHFLFRPKTSLKA